MTNTNTIRVKGWKTEITADSITFERGDWFCIARFDGVLTMSRDYERRDDLTQSCRIRLAARKTVDEWIGDGLPVKPQRSTYWAIIRAIAEAAQMNS